MSPRVQNYPAESGVEMLKPLDVQKILARLRWERRQLDRRIAKIERCGPSPRRRCTY